MSQDQLKLLYAILETKNSWGKNEIKQVLDKKYYEGFTSSCYR